MFTQTEKKLTNAFDSSATCNTERTWQNQEKGSEKAQARIRI